MPSSVHKVTVPMAVVLFASHPPRSALRPYVPSARTKFIIVQAADVRVDAGQLALQSHLCHEIQAVKFQVTINLPEAMMGSHRKSLGTVH